MIKTIHPSKISKSPSPLLSQHVLAKLILGPGSAGILLPRINSLLTDQRLNHHMTFIFKYYFSHLPLTLPLPAFTLLPVFGRMRFNNNAVSFYIDLLFGCILDYLVYFLR